MVERFVRDVHGDVISPDIRATVVFRVEIPVPVVYVVEIIRVHSRARTRCYAEPSNGLPVLPFAAASIWAPEHVSNPYMVAVTVTEMQAHCFLLISSSAWSLRQR